MKIISHLLTALVITLPLAGQTQTRTDALAEAWSGVPLSVLSAEAGGGLDLSFHSLTTARDILPSLELSGLPVDIAPLAITSPAYLVPVAMMADDWPEQIGFGVSQINHIVAFSAPPIRAHWYHLADGSALNIGAALTARGYETSEIEGFPMFTWGGDDFEIAITERENQDIFTSRLMQSARVAVVGDVVIAGTSTPFLSDTLDDRGPMVMDQPELSILLAALDDLDAQGAILQATLISQPARTFVSLAPPQTEPLGPWTFGLLAEITDGPTSTAVIAMAFIDAANAARGAETLAEAWDSYTSIATQGPIADVFPVPPVITVSESQERVVLFSFTQEFEPNLPIGSRYSAVYSRLYSVITAADASFLRPL